ncbi:MAG: sigma-54 dependent transcriptional regulator [bacterium]|nr:sigma-54 dependent transcriptional regulator [bacterium]
MDSKYQGMRLLLVEDDLNFSNFLKDELSQIGLEVFPVYRGQEALRKAAKESFDLVLLDLKLPDVDDTNLLQILTGLREIHPELPVIVLTGEGKIKRAVEAIKQGAYDFLEKPVSLNSLMIPLRNALDLVELRRQRNLLQDQIKAQFRIIGVSPAIKNVIRRLMKCAPTQSQVLIIGPTGAGKELVARAVHQASLRSHQKYLKINCAAIPRELIESELFGHRKGSFTGAIKDQSGKFAQADGGTIFLDEIGDLDPSAQAKLLRVLEDGEISPIGSDQPYKVDVRMISATNKDLQAMVSQGTFREDLYYRLSTVKIEIPPLKERPEDIPILAAEFLRRCQEDNGLAAKEFSAEAVIALTLSDWPGNVRQLKSIIEYICIFSESAVISGDDVNLALQQNQGAKYADDFPSLRDATQDFQRKVIIARLAKNEWNVAQTADELGINRTHFYKKLEDLRIEKP